MSDSNKTYRIKANVGSREETFINVKLDQDYDTFNILSLTLKASDTYRLQNANYGVIVGRVLANENFGVPNAKISVFIEASTEEMSQVEQELYPYKQTTTTDSKGVRYNLLPNEKIDDCHQPVGTFPTKSYLLDNDDLVEIFDNYYVYTTRTNNAGDYMICGVPTGNHELHMDLDLSDCGILSQRPRDFVYKGYTIEQFENPNMFKTGTTLSSLSQIFSQNQSVNVKPFWGNDDSGDEIGITRADIHISFTFEPTCVFMGCVVSDNASNGISQKCVPTNNMGAMDELTTGKGTIEIIRKTPGGNVEEFQVKGNQVIDGNGVWCYQIPMNLDYMMTDEYGNMVPTDDPSKGIPTRTRVRFRLSLEDFNENTDNYFRSKALIPNNPDISQHGNVDYNFGSETQDSSFRDLYWNNVYTVKSYIPRFQKSKSWKNKRFSGIKHCNIYGNNNPIPYNNIRVRLPLLFMIVCSFLTNFIKMTFFLNKFIYFLVKNVMRFMGILRKIAGIVVKLSTSFIGGWNMDMSQPMKNLLDKSRYILIGEKLCEDLEGWYFAPGANTEVDKNGHDIQADFGSGTKGGDIFLLQQTYDILFDKEEMSGIDDNTSIDVQNTEKDSEDSICLTTDIDYLLSCVEMQLAQEYKVIQFDFYNDWINGMIYLPRWKRIVKTKRTFWFISWKRKKAKIKGCMNANGTGTAKTRYMVQQCSLEYKGKNNVPFTEVVSTIGCGGMDNSKRIKLSTKYKDTKVGKVILNNTIQPQICHKKLGMTRYPVFGKKNGVVTEIKTSRNQYVYYLKPCEWGGESNNGKRALLFATDIILLGSLNDCDDNGIPQAFKYLESSSYKMPTNLALTTMDEDGYIYTTTGATICKRSSQENVEPSEFENGVRRQITTYQGISKAYSVNKPSEQINYENNDDPIAVTEAAGICWNYTGPGQDILGLNDTQMNLNPIDDITDDLMKQKYLYYPGGHFIGLSCRNSQTNIKSCINLKRICEVGATMSERHEIVIGYNEANNDFKYRYLVPTGFIAQDEINDVRFRTMFATMNHKKLIADRLDERTGYPIYGFKFMRPNGFDGSFSKYAYMDNTPYNHTAPDVVDETSVFEKLFAYNGWSKPDDYDPEESGYTETRTKEDTSKDYYMFRMGLNTLKLNDQLNRFLLTNGNSSAFMPQYENSFYFYFGLKDGATALDEFKRQFFSECDERLLIGNANLRVRKEINYCDLKGYVTLYIDGMIPEYLITIKNNKNNEVVEINGEKMEEVSRNKDVLTFELPVGIYTFTVEDVREQSKSITVDLGDSEVKIDTFRVVNFRTTSGITSGNSSNDVRLGGYIVIDKEITINGETYVFGDTFNVYIGEDSIFPLDFEFYFDAGGNEKVRLFGFKPNIDYDIYIEITCVRPSDRRYYVDTVNLKTNENIDLLYGCYALSYKKTLKDFPDNDWWENVEENLNWLSDIEIWTLKQNMFRQLVNDNESYDSNVIGYSSDGENVLTMVFGEPERMNRGYEVKKSGYSANDSDQYYGYVLNDNESYYPTWGILDGDEVYSNSSEGRICFSKMAYTSDGRAAADPLDITISNVVQDGDKCIVTFNGNVTSGVGYIVVFEDGEIVFPFVNEQGQGIYYGEAPMPNNNDWFAMATVYPTFKFPVMYRPFFATVKFLTFGWGQVKMPEITDTGGNPSLDFTLKPYFTGGELHNGVTFDNALSKDPYKTSINGFNLQGIYPDDTFNPDASGKEYIAEPLTGESWTINDTNPEYNTYEVGRELEIVGSANILGCQTFPGFPFYSQANTGTSFSYSFMEGHPEGFIESANTEYTQYTNPTFPTIYECSDSMEANFVDYIIFEHSIGDEGIITRRLYGNVESSEYGDGSDDNYLKYYDLSDYSLRRFFFKRYSGDIGTTVKKDAWVYTKDDTAKKNRPAATIACVSMNEEMVSKNGSNIFFIKVFDGASGDSLRYEEPIIVDGELKYKEKVVTRGGLVAPFSIRGDIMQSLEDSPGSIGFDLLYNMLVNESKLEPLRNPQLDFSGSLREGFTINFDRYIKEAYDSFQYAKNHGKEITLSNKKQFEGNVPTDVLGVCKHKNGRNETYVMKYFIDVYDFGSGPSQGNNMGHKATLQVYSDVETVPVTGSTFKVTVESNVDWILSITSTTLSDETETGIGPTSGMSITCQGNAIGTDNINAAWNNDYYFPTNIRDIQGNNPTNWTGATYGPGKYVFTVTMDENKSAQNLELEIFATAFYPSDDLPNPSVKIIQKGRVTIEADGEIELSYNNGSEATSKLTYDFCPLPEDWPDEMTLTVNTLCTIEVSQDISVDTTTYVDVDLSNVEVDVDVTGDVYIPGESGGTWEDIDATATSSVGGTAGGSGDVTGSTSTNNDVKVPVSFTITKDGCNGEVDVYSFSDGNADGMSTSTSISGVKLEITSATFNNLGDNYIGKSDITYIDSYGTYQYPTIIQPDQGNREEENE